MILYGTISSNIVFTECVSGCFSETFQISDYFIDMTLRTRKHVCLFCRLNQQKVKNLSRFAVIVSENLQDTVRMREWMKRRESAMLVHKDVSRMLLNRSSDIQFSEQRRVTMKPLTLMSQEPSFPGEKRSVLQPSE